MASYPQIKKVFLPEYFSIIVYFFLDILFPVSCLSCGAPDVWLCPDCFQKIGIQYSQVCPYCEKIETPAGRACPKCKELQLRKNSLLPLDNLIVGASYQQENIARLVHTFKYNFVPDLGYPLAGIIAKAVFENQLPLPDLIVPVPLHPRRLRWRGFNQAQVLAQNLKDRLSPGLTIPVLDDAIRRKRFTPPQMKIQNYATRQENLKGAFVLNWEKTRISIKGKSILLIDDVATTGSTLFECAKVLKAAGAKKVYAAVIARQEIK